MTHLEALKQRKSRRDFLFDSTLGQRAALHFGSVLTQLNGESGLSIELLYTNPEAINASFERAGFITGATAVFALIGEEGDPSLMEKIGYYGERLVLEIERYGLSSCWVGGTYDPERLPLRLQPGKKLCGVIPFGHVPPEMTAREKEIYDKVSAARKKPIEEMMEVDGEVPAWFIEGMKAVQLAPSAMNRQPIVFTYKDGKVDARVPGGNKAGSIDYGIAKCHFEIGSGMKLV